MATLFQAIAENWIVWFVAIVLVVAAVIDGMILKVPNWLTFPFIACGWLHWTIQDGISGLGWSLLGTVVGMMLLLVLRNVGGMGAGRRETAGRRWRMAGCHGHPVGIRRHGNRRWCDGRGDDPR